MGRNDDITVSDIPVESFEYAVETRAVDSLIETAVKQQVEHVIDEAAEQYTVDSMDYEAILDGIQILESNGFRADVGNVTVFLSSKLKSDLDLNVDGDVEKIAGVEVRVDPYLDHDQGLLAHSDAVAYSPFAPGSGIVVSHPRGLVEINMEEDDE